MFEGKHGIETIGTWLGPENETLAVLDLPLTFLLERRRV
jgi:hypothetical protein